MEEDPIVIQLQVAVMDIMEADTTDIIPTVLEAGTIHILVMVHMLVLSGVE
jgi:hypothetical protein